LRRLRRRRRLPQRAGQADRRHRRIRAIFQAFLGAFSEAKLDVVTLAAEPGLVLAERVDYFTMNDGTRVVLPVTGVFVVNNGEITRFSDYFDLADFERQSGFKL